VGPSDSVPHRVVRESQSSHRRGRYDRRDGSATSIVRKVRRSDRCPPDNFESSSDSLGLDHVQCYAVARYGHTVGIVSPATLALIFPSQRCRTLVMVGPGVPEQGEVDAAEAIRCESWADERLPARHDPGWQRLPSPDTRPWFRCRNTWSGTLHGRWLSLPTGPQPFCVTKIWLLLHPRR